jgi:Protein of unknown function (DUF2490)
MKKRILCILLFAPVLLSKAQDGLGLWSSVGIEKKLNKKFSINLSGQTRFVENISYLQTYFGELGLDYKINKRFEISANYRLINRRKNDLSAFRNRHRFYGDFAYNKKISKLKLTYRLRYQHQFKDNNGEIGFDSSYLRNKLEIAYPNKSKLTPYLSGDLFYEVGNQFDQIRPQMGVSYKINRQNGIDVSVLTNVDLVGAASLSPIINLGYKLKL